MKRLIVALFIFALIHPAPAFAQTPASYNITVPEPVTFSGSGGKSIGPINVVEGTLRIHITTTTDCQSCGFGLSVYEDNNLDGVYSSTDVGDDYLDSVWSAGYGDIQKADLWVNHSVMGGRIKIGVDTSSRVAWEIVVEQHPKPMHGIEVGVFEEGSGDYIFDATVTIFGEKGRKYSTGENSLYGYHHYYFNQSFYGYKNYTVIISAPGHASQTLTITLEDWTSLGFPHSALYKKVYLRSSESDALIYCKVRVKGSSEPVRGAAVTLKDLTGREVASTTSDDNGFCSFKGLVEGTYTLTATAKGFKEQTKQAEALSSRTVEQVIFELERGAPGIYGTVTDSELGDPVSNITVELTTYGGDEILDKTKTDSKGFYTFPELKPGDYGVGISNEILSSRPDERFYEPDGRIARLSGNDYKRIDFVLKPKGVDITAGFDVVSGREQNITVGRNYSVDIVISNNGPKDAEDVKLEVELDGAAEGSVEFKDATPSEGSCGASGDSIKCNLGRIQKNSVKTVSLTVKALKVGNFTLRVFGAESPVKNWEKKDWLPNNNRDNITVEIKPHKVRGQVAVPYIDYNAKPNLSNILTFGLSVLKSVPLKNVSVNLTHGTKSSIVYTDENGRYSFDINDTGSGKFSLQVELKDRKDKNGKSTIVIRSGKGFNSRPVVLKTKEIEIKGVETKHDVIFTSNYSYLDNSLSGNQKAVLQDAGVFYYNTYEALLFAKNKLKLNLDHKLPVDIYIYRPGCGACYTKSDSHIQTKNTAADSAFTSPDTPDNREYHEFGHHVQADSKMGGEDTYPNLRKNVPYKIGAVNYLHNDTNHKATNNTDSSDSFIEGFAEFFSSLVQGDPFYRWSGTVTDLSGTNYHTTGGNPDEEFNIASLLWDLYDKDSERGDYLALGIDGTWKILNSPNITTVRSLYLALNKIYGKNDTNKSDGLSDVDALFVLHRFYYDTDRDGTRDANESIGYGNTGPAHPWVKYPRNDKPRIPGTGLEFSVSDQSGNPMRPDAFIVKAHFPDSGHDFAYLTWPAPEDGYLWVVVPDNSLSVELTPVISGYSGEPFVQTPEEFWPAVKTAQAENKSTYTSHNFIVQENGVPAPEGFGADRINETAVRLVWNAGGSFILVRGIDHRPTYPGDGETVFEGSGAGYVDSGLLTGAVYHYTLFRVEDGKVSKGVSVSFETEIVQPGTEAPPKPVKTRPDNESAPPSKTTMPAGSETSTGSPVYPLLILVILIALIIWYWRRRKA